MYIVKWIFLLTSGIAAQLQKRVQVAIYNRRLIMMCLCVNYLKNKIKTVILLMEHEFIYDK